MPSLTVIGAVGQRAGRRARDDRAGGDRELGAVAGAVDGAVGDLVAQAADVRADRAEALEDVLGRLGDHDLGVGEDLPAADRDVRGLAEQGSRCGGAAWSAALPGRRLPRRPRWRRGRTGDGEDVIGQVRPGGLARFVRVVGNGGGAAPGEQHRRPARARPVPRTSAGCGGWRHDPRRDRRRDPSGSAQSSVILRWLSAGTSGTFLWETGGIRLVMVEAVRLR